MSKRFKQQLTEDFIAEWQKEECLWNIHCDSYKDRDTKYASYKRLSEVLEMEVTDVKEKINNLRTSFSRELRKYRAIKKNGGRGSDTYDSKWAHFKSLLFLRDSIIPRRTVSSMTLMNENQGSLEKFYAYNDLPDNLEDRQSPEEKEIIEIEPSSTKRTLERPPKRPSSNEGSYLSRTNYLKDSLLNTSHREKEKEIQRVKNSNDIDTYENSSDNSKRKKSEPEVEDPECTFGRHVANSLRGITNIEKREYTKLKIQEVLFQGRFGRHNNQMSYSPPHSPSYTEIPTTSLSQSFPRSSKMRQSCSNHNSTSKMSDGETIHEIL